MYIFGVYIMYVCACVCVFVYHVIVCSYINAVGCSSVLKVTCPCCFVCLFVCFVIPFFALFLCFFCLVLFLVS